MTFSSITIITVLLGFYAYLLHTQVKGDIISHAAMTVHRNLALITASAIVYQRFGWHGIISLPRIEEVGRHHFQDNKKDEHLCS